MPKRWNSLFARTFGTLIHRTIDFWLKGRIAVTPGGRWLHGWKHCWGGGHPHSRSEQPAWRSNHRHAADGGPCNHEAAAADAETFGGQGPAGNSSEVRRAQE